MALHASTTATKKKSRKYAVVGAAGLATILAAGGAWAAMQVTGSSSATVEAYQEKALTITNAQFSRELFPGGSVNLSFKVSNPNPFPVKLTTIGVKANTTPFVRCAEGEAQHLSGPLATIAATASIPEADRVTVPAEGGPVDVTIRNAIVLSNDAKKGCKLAVAFTVSGESAPQAGS